MSGSYSKDTNAQTYTSSTNLKHTHIWKIVFSWITHDLSKSVCDSKKKNDLSF